MSKVTFSKGGFGPFALSLLAGLGSMTPASAGSGRPQATSSAIAVATGAGELDPAKWDRIMSMSPRLITARLFLLSRDEIRRDIISLSHAALAGRAEGKEIEKHIGRLKRDI